MDHFRQAENQNTTHSASPETHSHGSTDCREKSSSCTRLLEKCPSKGIGQGVAPGLWVLLQLSSLSLQGWGLLSGLCQQTWCEVLLGASRGWDKGTREKQVLLGLGLWVPAGQTPFSGQENVLLPRVCVWGGRARGSQVGRRGQNCLLEAVWGHVARVENQNHPPNKQLHRNGIKFENWSRRLVQKEGCEQQV